MTLELAIVYSPAKGRTLSIARIEDPELLRVAALAAVRETQARAAELSESDTVLGLVEAEEAAKLQRTLAMLIPGLSDAEQRPLMTH